MKKIIAILSGIALSLFFATSVSAAAPNWDLRGTWKFNDIWSGTPYVHTMVIDSFDPVTGVFSGTGFYDDNTALTWDVNGIESGNDITLFHLYVTAVAPGVTIDGTGAINSTGTGISGIGYQSNLPGIAPTPNITWEAIGNAITLDSDGDGVNDINDLCRDTSDLEDPDWLEKWGMNRWKAEYGIWYQNIPKNSPKIGQPISYTYGCNGHQILDMLTEHIGENAMMGHYKFGISSSVLEEFRLDLNDGELDGIYLVDQVIVPGTNNVGITTSYATVIGINYKLEATGFYRFANWGEYGIADAKYNYRSAAYNGGFPGWVDGSTWGAPYQYYLQIKTSGGGIGWIEDYNAAHLYTASFAGDGNPIHFQILDDAYGDNSGSIHVKIFADL